MSESQQPEQQQATIAGAAVGVEIPPANVDRLFDSNITYTYIPWQMLTKEVLDAIIITPKPVENKKFNPKAPGSSVWVKVKVNVLKKLFPGFKVSLDEDRLCIRTPFMNSPFAISAFPEKPDDETIGLSYGRAKDEDVEPFAEWASQVFDPWFKNRFAEKSKEWIGQTRSLEVLDAAWAGLYRFTEADEEKGKSAATGPFKLRAGKKAQNPKGFHGETPIQVNKETIVKNLYLQMDVEISTIWINGPRCGISGTIARIDYRTPEEMANPGFACNPPEPAKPTDELPPPPPPATD